MFIDPVHEDWDTVNLFSYLKYSKLNIIPLTSKGFVNIFFFKAELKGGISFPIQIDTLEMSYAFFPKATEDVTFAYDKLNDKVYRLTGLPVNDFAYFFSVVRLRRDRIIDRAKTFKVRSLFLKEYYIEGVDLGCLFDSLKKKCYCQSNCN
jgi:hypothetical protein